MVTNHSLACINEGEVGCQNVYPRGVPKCVSVWGAKMCIRVGCQNLRNIPQSVNTRELKHLLVAYDIVLCVMSYFEYTTTYIWVVIKNVAK